MIFDLQLDLEALDAEMDSLIAVRDSVIERLDVLAQHRETKLAALAFASTEYTSHEVKNVNFFEIA